MNQKRFPLRGGGQRSCIRVHNLQGYCCYQDAHHPAQAVKFISQATKQREQRHNDQERDQHYRMQNLESIEGNSIENYCRDAGEAKIDAILTPLLYHRIQAAVVSSALRAAVKQQGQLAARPSNEQTATAAGQVSNYNLLSYLR